MLSDSNPKDYGKDSILAMKSHHFDGDGERIEQGVPTCFNSFDQIYLGYNNVESK